MRKFRMPRIARGEYGAAEVPQNDRRNAGHPFARLIEECLEMAHSGDNDLRRRHLRVTTGKQLRETALLWIAGLWYFALR